MKTREDVLVALRNINIEWDAEDLTLPERANLDAGAVMLLWVLGWEDRLYEHAGPGPLMHDTIRLVTTIALVEEI